ncbi:PEGA domain-containing protein [Kribbella sp.]|uniref:PEGA domain-containing protein n=1 Tax=Kribbella sp. TaxID=1871183 RepID=UPI002D2A7D56|nr:PEGA domain-containing protein [Kribbella sp.]HZX01616.1 PEGA domain-containing protein [Kribbella sp.]
MLEENRRPLMIGGVVALVLIVLIGSIVLFRGGAPETKLSVQSIPNDLTLTLDGHQIPANGEIKVKSGKHTIAGTRRGFESYSEDITVTGDNAAFKMYLYANGAEGRQWVQNHPEQEVELEREASANFDEMQARLIAKYPILGALPYVGQGFEATRAVSKSDPKNPLAISVHIDVFGSKGRDYALKWITGNGWDPNTLDIIWTNS